MQFLKFVCALTVCILSINADAASPTSEELFEGLRFVHLTRFLRQHTVVPGKIRIAPRANFPLYNLFSSAFKSEAYSQRAAFYETPFGLALTDFNFFMVTGRITTHWSINEGVMDDPDLLKDAQFVMAQWDENPIGIIEPAKYFKGQIYGGFDQDMIVMGPHQLSKEAVVLAPKRLESILKRDNPDYPGTFYFYDNNTYKNARSAIQSYNNSYLNSSWKLQKPKHELQMTA